MAATVQQVVPRVRAVQYDGTNGTDVAANFPGGQVLADDGLNLLFQFEYLPGSVDYSSVAAGSWVIYRLKPPLTELNGSVTDAVYQAFYSPIMQLMSDEDQARVSFLGQGVGTNAGVLGIGATVNIDSKVMPPIPAVLQPGAQLQSTILAVGGVSLGTIAIVATPVIQTALVPAGTSGGVLTPAHTLVRTQVKNNGLGVLSTVQVFTTAHV